MFTNFNEAERAVHYPKDRRLIIGLKPYVFVIAGIALLATIGVAWIQYLVFGLPEDPSSALTEIGRAHV